MKAIFHRILTTTALCLAAVGLSSCYSTLYKNAWNRAKIIDEAYWVQDEENIELYRVGDTVYAKGFIGPARGDQKKGWQGSLLVLHPGSGRQQTCIHSAERELFSAQSRFTAKPSKVPGLISG